MIIEVEIRKYRDALKFAVKESRKCGCPRCNELFESEQTQIDLLSWILEEHYEFANHVENFFKWQAEHKAKVGK